MASLSVTELKEERRAAFEELGSTLEAISVKNLMEFRGRLEVPRPVQSVAVASVCMVARVDDTVEVGSDGLPPRTWEAVQANTAKPGHFVNSLRQFPYAVDSGRMPDANIYAARQCLEDVSPEHLANEPMALRLYEWILAAWRYTEVVQMLRLQSSVSGAQTAMPQVPEQPQGFLAAAEAAGNSVFQAAKATEAAFFSSNTADTPPSSPEPARTEAAPLDAADTPGKPMRSSMGSSVGGNSVFGGPSPGGESTRSSRPSGGRGGAQAPGGGRGVGTRAPAPRVPRRSAGQESNASTFKVSPSNSPSSAYSPPSQRASPSQPSTRPQRQNLNTSAGYPRGAGGPPRSNVGIEDLQQKLEQMRREAREMKAMEGQLKWTMKRDEDKQKSQDSRQDKLAVMKWRQEQAKGLQEYAGDRANNFKLTNLRDQRDFQEFKRSAKKSDQEEDLQQMKDQYVESKDVSEFATEMKRIVPIEDRKVLIDQNLDRCALMSMYALEESQREKQQQTYDRNEFEEVELGHQMLQASKERDSALQSLEFFRLQSRQTTENSQIWNIPSRPPIVPDNRPI